MFELFCLTFAGATALALWIANPARVSTYSHWRTVRRHALRHDRNTASTTTYPRIGA